MHCSPEPNGVCAHRGQLTFWKTKQQNPHHLDSSCFMEGAVAQPKPSICGRLRQEDRHQVQVSLGFSARHGLKKNPYPQTKQNTKSASKGLSACKMQETHSPFGRVRATPRLPGHQGVGLQCLTSASGPKRTLPPLGKSGCQRGCFLQFGSWLIKEYPAVLFGTERNPWSWRLAS